MSERRECITLIGDGARLVIKDGQWVKVPYFCSKPATIEGPDGVIRCPQHDRMARGLSGRCR